MRWDRSHLAVMAAASRCPGSRAPNPPLGREFLQLASPFSRRTWTFFGRRRITRHQSKETLRHVEVYAQRNVAEYL